ncbi:MULTISPECIES: hypothetical protein [Bradyrhizobium]|uniref:hypothetical protein n=1 Tax=Bradyrhizobium elkanii TaxID=29448 RepID=UPI000427B346|nr:hypothetical protein [Bradyrhizobium elkanii]
MSADAYGSILGLILQGTGNNNNNWGVVLNTSMISPTERAIAGVNTISSAGGTVDLSTVAPPTGLRLDLDYIQLLNGALTSHLTVVVPNVSKTWWFQNNTTGNFNVYVKTPSGTAPPNLVQIPQGVGIMVMCDGSGNLIRHDDAEIGSFRISGKASIGAGELACNGASLLKADFPNLHGKISTTWGSVDSLHFTLANFTDTARFLRSSSGTLAVGTYQSNQNAAHTHAVTGSGTISGVTTTNGDHFHAAGIFDPGHTHTINGQGNLIVAGQGIGVGGGGAFGVSGASLSNSTNATGVRVNSSNGIDTTYSAGSHAHNVSGSCSVNFTSGSSGGTEARPEAAVVLVGIRY